jgi:hypothetical protein
VNLTTDQMLELQQAGDHLQGQLQTAYGDIAKVDVRYEGARTLERQAATGQLKVGGGSKVLYVMAGGGPEAYQAAFAVHGETLSAASAFELANAASMTAHAIGTAGTNVGVVNARKLISADHASNVVLHEGIHLGGYRFHSAGVMSPGFSPSAPLLPVPSPVGPVLRWNLGQ